jgi:hypothetical protein
MAAFICKRQVAPKYYMGGVFRDYVLFASLFIGTLHAEGKLDDHGKTLSISLL